VPEPAPFVRQCSDGAAHFEGHVDRLERWVLYRHRIVEDDHHAVAGVAFESAAVLDDDFANRGVVLTQQHHYVFSICAFSEPREAS
jgi:hypothetical protein